MDAAQASELKTMVVGIESAWHEFKAANDSRLAELEKGAENVVLLATTVDTINATLTEKMAELTAFQERLQKAELALDAPQFKGESNEVRAANAYKHAWLDWLRSATVEGRTDPEKAAVVAERWKEVTTTIPGSGGYAVPEEIARDIEKFSAEQSVMMQVCRVVTVGTSDYKELVDTRGQAYGWVGETDPRPATGTSTLEEIAPPIGMIYAYPKATEESLQDMFFDVQGWITEEASDGFGEGMENAYTVGDGLKKPLGFLDQTVPATTQNDAARAFGVLQYTASGAAAALNDPDVLVNCLYSLRKTYRNGAIWMMNSNTEGVVRLLKDGDGNYIWQPNFQAGAPSTLLGYALQNNEEMPDVAADALPIAFGNFRRGYTIVNRVGMSMTVDDNITEPGYVKFYIRRRVGGHLRNSQAIKVVKIALA